MISDLKNQYLKKIEYLFTNLSSDIFSAKTWMTSIFLLVLFTTVNAAWIFPVKSGMEARNLRTAEEIIQGDSWLIPTLNGEPRIRKPPLPTWFAAGMAKLAQDTRNLLLLRLPSILAALLMLFFVFRFTADLYDRKTAVYTTLVLATMGQFFREATIARWDIFACCFSFGALWLSFHLARRWHWMYFCGAALLWGLSYLSKGPAQFYVVLLPFFATLCIFSFVKNLHMTPVLPSIRSLNLIQWFSISGVVIIGIVLGNLWWFTVWLKHPETWEILGGDMVSLNKVHQEPFYYYLPLVFALSAPWTIFLVLSFSNAFIQKRTVDTSEDKSDTSTCLFPFVWFLVGLFFISLIPAKKSRYFLGLLPMIAICIGRYLAELSAIEWEDYLLKLHRAVIALAAAILPLGFCFLAQDIVGYTVAVISFGFWILSYFIMSNPIEKKRLALETWVVASLTIGLFFSCLGFQSSHREIVEKAFADEYKDAQIAQPYVKGKPLIVFGGDNTQLLWNVRHNYQQVTRKETLQAKLANIEAPFMLLVEIKGQTNFAELFDGYKLKAEKMCEFTVDRKKVWYLFQIIPVLKDNE